MYKKKVVFGSLILCIAVLLVFLSLFIYKQCKIHQAISMYHDFIDGNISVGGWDIIEISTPTGEPERRYQIDYTDFELNTSGEPINESNFSWIDNHEDYTFDEDEEYLFDGSLCTFEEWYDLTRESQYAAHSESGNETTGNTDEVMYMAKSKHSLIVLKNITE